MTEIQPKISVVIPAYNAERYLREALESVLAQHYPALDILVIDDGSAHGTAGVAQSVTGVRYVPQKNAGAAAARNHGVRLAEGEWIAFLDADYLRTEGKLSRQSQVLRRNPGLTSSSGRPSSSSARNSTPRLRQGFSVRQAASPAICPEPCSCARRRLRRWAASTRS